MPRIIPIRDLKEPSKVSNMVHEDQEPIFVTKNGYGDMVLMDIDYYNRMINGIDKNDVYSINEIVRILRPIFEKNNVKSAILFGSYAKGIANKNSDIDILVDSGLHGLNFFGLLEEVSTSLNKEVDLLDVRQIVPNSKVDNEIKKSGVRIYGK